MMTDTSAAGPAPSPGTKAKAKRAAKAGAPKTGECKESKGEELLHELCRRMGFDARGDKHASGIVADLGKLIGCVPWMLVLGFVLRSSLLVAVAIAFGDWCGNGFVFSAWNGLLLGAALDVVSFSVTAPGATGTAMAAAGGDSASARNCPEGNLIRLSAMWSKAQAVGFTSLTYPSGNDTTRGVRYRNVANQPGNMLARGVGTVFQPQEPLTLVQAGSAVAGDVELAHLLVYYENLPGVNAMLIDAAELASRLVRLVTVEDTVTPTVASTYSGARAINAASALLRANTQYAILGAKLGAVCGALTVRGPDVGNLRCAVPGLTTPDVETVNWFAQLSEWYGVPMIPTFNNANAPGTFVEVMQDENLTAVPFSLLLAELTDKA